MNAVTLSMAKGCSVFVGNIDFDVPEDTLIKNLSTVGRVVNFRMMIDKNTGKSKGYGFCEYETPLIAETAVQKLKIVLNGRQIRINKAEHDVSEKKEVEEKQELPIAKIKSVFDEMNKDHLKDVLKYFKNIAQESPVRLTEIFQENPGLAFSALYSLSELKLIDSEVVKDFMMKNFLFDENLDLFKVQIQSMANEQNDLDPDLQIRLKKIRDKMDMKRPS